MHATLECVGFKISISVQDWWPWVELKDIMSGQLLDLHMQQQQNSEAHEVWGVRMCVIIMGLDTT